VCHAEDGAPAAFTDDVRSSPAKEGQGRHGNGTTNDGEAVERQSVTMMMMMMVMMIWWWWRWVTCAKDITTTRRSECRREYVAYHCISACWVIFAGCSGRQTDGRTDGCTNEALWLKTGCANTDRSVLDLLSDEKMQLPW